MGGSVSFCCHCLPAETRISSPVEEGSKPSLSMAFEHRVRSTSLATLIFPVVSDPRHKLLFGICTTPPPQRFLSPLVGELPLHRVRGGCSRLRATTSSPSSSLESFVGHMFYSTLVPSVRSPLMRHIGHQQTPP